MKKKIILVTALLVCFLACAARTSAVIESWSTHLILPAANDLTIKEFVRIRVLDENGYRHAVFQDYYNAFRKIKSLRYTIYDASNKKIKKLSRNDALDIMINSSYEIGDARMVVLDPKYRNFPFTVEIEVEITYNGFLDFPLWMPRYTHDLEVKKADLTLECYKDFEYRARELNGVGAPTVTIMDNIKTVYWKIENLPAIERHISYKSLEADQAKVHLAPVTFNLEKTTGDFQSWANFGDWYQTLNEGRNEISSATKEVLTDLRKKYGDDTEAIAKEVYKFMQSRTRYISIQLGIGGYQTIPSDEVEKSGYGDCKALTNYMKAMLDFLNIPANNVLVKAGRDVPDILHDFPSNQFNHVFLAVPMKSDTLWFECTSQTTPPAFIGTFTDDRYVLWIDKNKSRILRTPTRPAHESVVSSHCVINIQPQGDALLDLKVTQTGAFFDEAMYYQNLTKDRIDEFNYEKFSYKDFSIQSFNFSVPDKNYSLLNLDYKLKVNGLGKPLGTKMILPFNVLAPLDKAFDMDILNRKTEIRRSFTTEDHVEIALPENYRVDLAPESVKEIFPFGIFEMRFESDNKGVLHIYRRAVIEKGNYNKETFDRFYDMVKKIKTAEQSKIILQSKT